MSNKHSPYENTNSQTTDPTIFVQIASYRDPECQHTVHDLFDKAAKPGRIKVGICWQFDPLEDKDCFRVKTRENQVVTASYHWREGQGVCWARHQVQKLWQGEPYTLMIDSHMRFTHGWDEALLVELERCPADNPLLTGSPASYKPPNQLSSNLLPTVRRAQLFNAAGEIRFRGSLLQSKADHPLNGAFIAAGFIFASSRIITEVPYDPYLYFNHEEISLALRFFTHGWDVFHPTRQFLYHYYRDPNIPSDRPLHNTDLNIRAINKRSLTRYRHLTGQTVTQDSEVLLELERYDLGRTRTQEDFEDYSGLNFKTRTASEKALRCGFIKGLNRYVRRIYVPELDDTKPNQHETKAEKTVATTSLPNHKSKSTKLGLDNVDSSNILRSGLEPGSFLPLFTLPDQDGKLRQIHFYGGLPTYLFFLPFDDKKLMNFFRALELQERTIRKQVAYRLYLLPAEPEVLQRWRNKHGITLSLWADSENTVAGLCRVESGASIAFLTNENLQVLHAAPMNNPGQQLPEMVKQAGRLLERPAPQVARRQAPILIVENVLSSELIGEILEYWNNGRKYEGKVGAVGNVTLRKDSKIRTDCFIHDRVLLEKLDQHFIQTLFPEIEKVYGTFVTHREDYKIGCYTADEGGFFKMHRDNHDRPLSYRRQAIVLILNDDFEGGHLLFPEYGGDYYSPLTGSAVVFPCSLMHQVAKVTAGNRYVLVSFLYDEKAAKLRMRLKVEQGTEATPNEWRVIPVRDDPHAYWSRSNNIARDEN